jgi:chemotaxis protein MotB
MATVQIQLQRFDRPSRAPQLLRVFMVLLLGALGYFGHGLYREEQALAAAARAEAAEARVRALAAEQERRALTEEIAALEAERARLAAERQQRLAQGWQPSEEELTRLCKPVTKARKRPVRLAVKQNTP